METNMSEDHQSRRLKAHKTAGATTRSAFDGALSKVAVELGDNETAAIRSDLLDSTSSSRAATGDRPTDPPSGEVSPDTCNFLLLAVPIALKWGFEGDKGHSPMQALEEGFRDNAKSQKLEAPEVANQMAAYELELMLIMARPMPEFIPGSKSRFVAYDSAYYRGDAMQDQACHQAFWEDQINIRNFSTEFVKSGKEIWKTLGIEIPPERTKEMMLMESIDDETSKAAQIALWSAFNTSRYPIDMETAAFVLATFIHSHPVFKRFVSDEAFIKPYGDNTHYGLLEIDEGDEE
jgi:hypothetical protein